jgi:hypothetical protein
MDMEPRMYIMSHAQKQQIEEAVIKLLSTKEEVRFAFLFGSFIDDTEETPLPIHDVDVGVYLSGLNKKESVYYALELAGELSFSVQVPVDVRVLNFAPVTFLFHVVRGKLIIDKDEEDRSDFMEHVVRHYLDMEPLFHRAVKEAYG